LGGRDILQVGEHIMSLRDQLIAKGLASKKQARKANQEMKRKRKSDQGSRAQEKALRREREAEAKKEAEARAAARRERNLEQKATEERRRGQQIVSGNRVGANGPIPFHFRKVDGRTLGRISVHNRAASTFGVDARGSRG
jgi:polyhydroxyalkanoate synthesis regulator phasin